MAGIEEVMERLVTDAQFREQLETDAESALAGYDLTEDEAALLAAGLEEGGGQSRVEQRTSKAGLAGLFAEAVGGGVTADRGTEPEPATGTGGLTGERGSESHVGLLLPAIQKVPNSSAAPADLDLGTGSSMPGQPTQPGTYRWRAMYSGDANYDPPEGEDTTLVSPPEVDETQLATINLSSASYPDPPKDVADGLSNTVLAGEVEPAESGDPDQPIVSGRVYNADTTSTGDAPPSPASA